MPRVKTVAPEPSREKGQRSIDLENYLSRILPPWSQPEWYEATQWRYTVARQPMAVICRDTLLDYCLALDWKIEPRDSTKRDEYKSEIDYYTKFLQYTGDYDYSDIVLWVGKDTLDIPFGGAAELGREGDAPDGKVLWCELLDGGTLFPTLNSDWPIGQALKELPLSQVYFPYYAIDRIYYNPRTEIRRKGWGMAPPEKVYLALELLNRGDVYYANLLLDTPQIGILDLVDMDKESASEWVKSWKSLLGGIDPFKIPVLYEHEKAATFIPFTKSPTELMFDKAIGKYNSIVAAGYGLSLSDVGISAVSSGGETLAGSIRQERKTRKSGLAVMKRKLKAFFDKIVPEYLQFMYIDLDDETSVAIGRARLANATAWTQAIASGMFTAEEARQQTIADGLVSISVPEKLPEEAKQQLANAQKPAERPSMLGRPVAPSAGGQGEVRADILSEKLKSIVEVEPVRIRKLVRQIIEPIKIQLAGVVDILEDDQLLSWNDLEDEILWQSLTEDIAELDISTNALCLSILEKSTQSETWWKVEVDPKEVAEDLLDTAKDIRLRKLKTNAELHYENGTIENLVLDFPNDPAFTRKYKTKVAHEVSETLSKLPVAIRKAIISGTRKYLSSYVNASTLDTEIVMNDNMVVDYVKRELDSAINSLLYEFADNVANVITILMEDK